MQDKQSKIIKVLFLGDVVGQPGCRAIFTNLSNLIKTNKIDFTIINGENAYDGFGITEEIANNFFSYGADVITSGNHIFQNDKIFSYMEARSDILRPANYPATMKGSGFFVCEKNGQKLAVINLIGRQQLVITDCPFKSGLKIVRELSKQTKNILIDFHAEVVEEKQALFSYLDGKVSAVVGTHTHVQTADERVSEQGSAYISDVGMCGPKKSVIGGSIDISINRFVTQLPEKMVVADGETVISGVIISIDSTTGKAISIERLNLISQ